MTELSGRGLRRHLLIHRRNGLRRVVSHLMAQRTGVYVQKQRVQSSSPASRQLAIDPSCISEGVETHPLLGWLEIYDRAHQQMREGLTAWCLQHQQPAPLELGALGLGLGGGLDVRHAEELKQLLALQRGSGSA